MKRKKGLTQRDRKKQRQEYSELGEYLSHHGIKLGDERHSTGAETDHIVRELSLKLLDTEEREKFFVTLQDHIDNTENLKVAMLPLIKEDSSSHFNSESLIRLLLRIPSLADPITELLLEKLPIIAEDKNCNLAALIVSQLRWMTSLSSDIIVSKLNEVLPVCPLPVQKEMISGLPELLSDDRHDDACLLLLDQISTIDLVPGILEALSELSLNAKMLEKVYTSVEELLSALSADSVPSALRFLLSTSEPEKAITSIREHIQFESLCQSGEGMEAEEMSMECLEQILRFHSKTQKCWLSQLQRSSELSVFDLLVYLILYRVNSKPKNILGSIKHHIKQGSLGTSNIQELYTKHSKTATLFTPELLRISHNLLLSFPDHPVTSLLYLSIFVHGDMHAKQEVVGALISHIGSGQNKEINSGIKTLALIKDKTDTTLDRFSSLLNGLLDYLNTLSIAQAREVLFLLVKISSSGSSRIIDDIHIITTKYLTHSSLKLKKLGVIGSCALIQALSVESADKTETFIKKVLRSLASSPSLLALLYDELAACVSNRTVDAATVTALYDQFITLFQETYIQDTPCDTEHSNQVDILCIEGSETLENNEFISINLWKFVEANSSDDLVVLFPLLRLVGASVAFLHGNDMADIDSILGCYIRCLPLADIPTSNSATVGLLALANLIIELINAFHVETKLGMRNKVTHRVKILYELLGMLKQVPLSENMVPMVFDLAEDIGGNKNKKGQSSKSLAGTAAALDRTDDDTSRDVFSFDPNKDGTPRTSTQLNTSDGAAATINKSTRSTKHLSSWSAVSRFKGFIREIDLSALSILNYNLLQNSLESNPDSGESLLSLNLPETCMLLEDLLVKCKFKLKPPSAFVKPDNSLGFSRISTISDTKFIQQLMLLLPALCQLMEDNVTESKENQSQRTSQNESIMNSTEDEIAMMAGNPFKVKIFELIFTSLEMLFSWSGFSSNSQVSTECFTILGSRLHSNTQGPLSVRRKHALQYLLNFRASCETFSSIIGLLKCCSVISSSKDRHIADICKECLQKEWEITADEKENKVRYNEGIGYIVKTFLSHSSEDMSDLLELVIEELNMVVKGKKEEQDKMFPTFTRATLPTIYKIALTHLISYQQTISSDKENGFSILTSSIAHFSTLISYIKTVNVRPILRAALLYGQKFLEQFLSVGLPLLGGMIQDNYVEVQVLLKKIQTSTRFLHHVTCHSKSSKDIALTARVPLLKKFLEAFVLKVKAMLAANGCTEAFWVGNLKQRNLKGEEIVSQQVEEEEEEEEGDVDDLSELSVDTDEDEEEKEEDKSSKTEENSDSMSIGY